MTGVDIESPIFQLESVGVKATAQLRGDQFVVFKGSQARVEVVDSYETGVTTTYKLLRSTLIDQGKLQLVGSMYEFTEDVAFDTPTPAAIVVLGRNDGGPKSWRRLLDSGQQQTYGQWLQENRASLPQSITAQVLEPVVTTWQPFFHDLAHKLLEYEDRQPELVQLLRDAGVSVQNDEGEPLTVLDPFSFFSLILKHTSFKSVQPILVAVRSGLDLQAELPTDLMGVPWSNPMNAWFFAYRSNRQPDDLRVLWALARQAVQGQLEPDTFAAALRIRQVKLAKLTQGLFWLNPQAFLPLNSVNVPYLEARGVRGAGKVQSLAEFDAVLTATLSLAPDFVTLSHSAWLDSQLHKEVATLEEDGSFPWTAFQTDAAKHPNNAVKGNMLLDDRYAPLLLQLTQETAPSALKPSRSPFKGRDGLAVRIALSSAEDSAFAHALLLPEAGSDGGPLDAGLTLSVGIAEGQAAAFGVALRFPETQQRLLEALLSDDVAAKLSVTGYAPLPASAERSAEISKQLKVFTESSEPIRRFQVNLTLLFPELQSEDFTAHLESALRYADELKGVLDDLAHTALPISPPPAAIQAIGAIPNAEPLGFTPPQGVPLNQILYGPPGTGKTHRVVDEALRVLEPQTLFAHPGSEGRAQRKARYDALVGDGQITFTTFHQSFGYEDFIEGIKPVMRDGQLHYELEDGLFLQAVRAAGGNLDSAVTETSTRALPYGVDLNGQVWRIFIDGTVPDSQVRTRSVERGEIRLGNLFSVEGKNPPAQSIPKDLNAVDQKELHAQQLLFRDAVRVSDLVLLSTSQDAISAVGVVTGDYRFDQSETIFANEYAHARSVRWLAKDLNWKVSDFGRRLMPGIERYSDLALGASYFNTFANERLLHVFSSFNALRPKAILEMLNYSTTAISSNGLRPHVLIVDEINRGNVAKIFGELITLLEPSKRAGAAEGLTVRLPLSKRTLSVPQSLYIVGTMNTADRSLTALDAALRRRFVFHPVWPDPTVLPVIDLDGTALDLPEFLSAINQRIERLLSREQMIGHAYLLDIPASLEGVAQALEQRILPLLEEYFFEDWSLIRQVLGDDQKPLEQQFICEKPSGATKRFERNPRAFESIEAFVRVYSGANDLSSD